jgi:uncharacterized protein YpmS
MLYFHQRVMITLITLAVAGMILACLPSVPFASGGPSAPCAVNISNQAADNFTKRIQQIKTSKGQAVTITVTSDELSSLLAQSLAAAKQSDPNIVVPIENPVICFQNGKMSVYAQVKTDATNTINALISVRAAVSGGRVAFGVDQIQVGSFSLPKEVGDQVSTLLNDALNQNLTQINLVEIKIGNGQMTLTGRVQ